jgi:hypothetical protein
MNQVNPWLRAARQSNDPLKSAAKKARFIRGLNKGKEYLTEEHDYVLSKGGTITDETRTMNGREARMLNDEMRMDFIEKVQNGVPAMLKKWIWLKPKEEKKKVTFSDEITVLPFRAIGEQKKRNKWDSK